jgi:hypothetical protein
MSVIIESILVSPLFYYNEKISGEVRVRWIDWLGVFMKAKCYDCERTVRGCKIITKIIHKTWIENGGANDFLGKPVCRACLNFNNNLEKEFGRGEGFYEAS